ncbi:MAG: lamin tail domain-containing protein [Flavobacteriales bacterium]
MKSILSFILTLSSFSLIAQDCSELFFSEYVEGSSNNKAVEIYNPTDAPIDLSSYSIERYSNGSDAVSDEMDLSGTLNAGETWIVTNSDTNSTNEFGYIMVELYNMADQWAPVYPSPLYMNGNDAMTLSKNGTIIDIIGKIGEDPGDAWTDDATAGFTDANGGAWWTKNHTLVRKASVKSGVKTSPILFNPAAEWDSLSINTWTNLGTHECDCSSGSPSSIEDKSTSFVLYPNPATNMQTINVSANKAIKSFELINALGQKVNLNYTHSNSQAYIHTHNINSGIYSLTIIFEDNSIKNSSIVIN